MAVFRALRVILVAMAILASSASILYADVSLVQIQNLVGTDQSFISQFHMSRSIAILSKPLTSTGSLTVVAGKGIRWSIVAPIYHTIIMGKEGITEFNNECQSYGTQSGKWQRDFIKVFGALVSGKIEQIQNQFQISTQGTLENWRIQLLPKAHNLQQALGTLVIEGTHHQVQRAILMQGDDATTITFSDQVPFDQEALRCINP